MYQFVRLMIIMKLVKTPLGFARFQIHRQIHCLFLSRIFSFSVISHNHYVEVRHMMGLPICKEKEQE